MRHSRASLLAVAFFIAAMLAVRPGSVSAAPSAPNTGTLTGVVTAADTGLPLAGAVVWARQYTAGGYTDQTAITASNGSYSFPSSGFLPTPGLQAGLYRVRFTPPQNAPYLSEWYDDSPSESGGSYVTIVDGGTTSNISAALARSATITGTLSTADGGAPSYYDVALHTLDGQSIANITVVGAPSVYTFTGIPSGAYKVSARAPGYLSEFYADKADFASADVVNAAAPGITPNIDIDLQPGGRISGRITAADTGLPLAGAWVRAFGPTGALSPVSTNASGEYVIDVLSSGNYRLSFEYVSLPHTYLSEWYNDRGIDPQSPDIVAVTAPNTVANIDAALDRAAAIQGLVVAADTGTPLGNMNVSAARPCQPPTRSSTFNGGPGRFSLSGLSSGAHTLRVEWSTMASSRDWVEEYAWPVSVVAPDTVSVTIPLQRGGQISGTVRGAGGATLYDVAVIASGATHTASFTTGPDGRFFIMGLPAGSYTLRALPRTGAQDYAPSLNAGIVAVTPPNTTEAGDITLALGGTISGAVTAADIGLPIKDVQVVLYTPDGVATLTGSRGLTDALGRYVINGVPAGTYRVGFNEAFSSSIPEGAAYVPEYYNNQPVSSTATLVTVPAGPVAIGNINAALDRGGQIGGRVVDAYGIALENVRVRVYSAAGELLREVRTDRDGTYLTRPGLTTGQYKVRFDYIACNGAPYATVFYRAVSAQSALGSGAGLADATPVAVVSGQRTSNIDGVLVAGSSTITGRVTNSGAPASSFKLALSNGDEAATDAGGYFTFTAVYTGSFALAPVPGMSVTSPASRIVTVPPNASGQDFAIVTTPQTYSISGRVTRDGAGLGGFALQLNNGRQMTTNADGSFAIADLSAGAYTISPAAGMPPTTPASRTINVPPNATNVDFAAGSRITLPVIVRWE